MDETGIYLNQIGNQLSGGNSEYYIGLFAIGEYEGRNWGKNDLTWQGKKAPSQRQRIMPQVVAFPSTVFVQFGPWLFINSKTMFQEKKFGSNEKSFVETEAYFEFKDKSFCKKGIKMLVKR